MSSEGETIHATATTPTLEETFDAHGTAAFGLAYRILGDTARAEDAVQEAFIAFWMASASFDPLRASTRTFLLAIVHHKCIDDIRKQGRRAVREHAFHASNVHFIDDGPEEMAERAYDANIVREGLSELPDTHRQVLELAYFEGLTCREIAERIDIPLGTVKSRMRHGLDKLAALVTRRLPPRPKPLRRRR
jgi:RNA polymerase sigma-70 factor (ECF subfamily)